MADGQEPALHSALLSRRQYGGFNPHALPEAGGGGGARRLAFSCNGISLVLAPIVRSGGTDRRTDRQDGKKEACHASSDSEGAASLLGLQEIENQKWENGR